MIVDGLMTSIVQLAELLHSAKVNCHGISTTLLGILISLKLVHLWKLLPPTLVILLGIVTLTREVQPRKDHFE